MEAIQFMILRILMQDKLLNQFRYHWMKIMKLLKAVILN